MLMCWDKNPRYGMISYKTKNGTFTMNFFYGGKHFDIFQVYLNDITLWFTKIYSFEKKNSKVQKMVTLGSTSTFFSSTTPYKRTQELQKYFIDNIKCYLLGVIIPSQL
jgi:hypothetical protein